SAAKCASVPPMLPAPIRAIFFMGFLPSVAMKGECGCGGAASRVDVGLVFVYLTMTPFQLPFSFSGGDRRSLTMTDDPEHVDPRSRQIADDMAAALQPFLDM